MAAFNINLAGAPVSVAMPGDVAAAAAGTSAVLADAAAAAALSVSPASFTTITAAYTATSFSFLAADTSGGSFPLELPAEGGTVVVRDPNGSWETNPLTIDGNGRTIDGEPTMEADLTGYKITFTSSGLVWRYTLDFEYGG